eukprot:tig00021146_g19053.t1
MAKLLRNRVVRVNAMSGLQVAQIPNVTLEQFQAWAEATGLEVTQLQEKRKPPQNKRFVDHHVVSSGPERKDVLEKMVGDIWESPRRDGGRTRIMLHAHGLH